MTVKGLPQEITHRQVLDAIRTLGIDPNTCSTVTIDPAVGRVTEMGVSVVAFDFDADDRRHFAEVGGGYAKHHVTYTVEKNYDDEEADRG